MGMRDIKNSYIPHISIQWNMPKLFLLKNSSEPKKKVKVKLPSALYKNMQGKYRYKPTHSETWH